MAMIAGGGIVDRVADLRRLLRGRGFRRAHLRREIDALE
jgi:hypothetical protein